jgi:hypothetical protein
MLEDFVKTNRMKPFASLLFLFGLVILYLVFFSTVGNDGTVLIGCANVAQTRGGTICLDNAYRR